MGHSISLFNVKFDPYLNRNQIFDRLSSAEIGSDRHWFDQTDIDKNGNIESTMYFKSSVFIDTYDSSTSQIVKLQTQIVSAIDFVIDLSSSVIELHSSVKSQSIFTSKMKLSFPELILLELSNVDLNLLLKWFDKEEIDYSIVKVEISEYLGGDGGKGKYTPTFQSNKTARLLLKKYSRLIDKLHLKILIDDSEVKVVAYNVSKLNYFGSAELTNFVLSSFKKNMDNG